MIKNMTEISPDTVGNEVLKMKNDGHRFVTMSCTELDEKYVDILYHFDKDLEMTHLRMKALKDQPVPSVSGIFFAALLVENEMRDMFGLAFDGLVLDFNRTLYLDEEVTEVPLVSNVKIVKQ